MGGPSVLKSSTYCCVQATYWQQDCNLLPKTCPFLWAAVLEITLSSFYRAAVLEITMSSFTEVLYNLVMYASF